MALFNSIWDDIRSVFRVGNMVKKLMLFNFIIFIAVQIVFLILTIVYGFEGNDQALESVLEVLSIPSQWRELLWRPWTLFTHMFLHADFWHVLGNIVWLSIFGTIVGDLIGDRRVLPVYLLGGLAGGIIYFMSASFMPDLISRLYGPYALGASAAVMAFAGAALVLAPDYRVGLFLIGEVKLKYIVLVMVLLDLVGFARMYNAGGHTAHLGGFIMGIVFVYRLRDGVDWADPVNRVTDAVGSWFSPAKQRPGPGRTKMKVTHRNQPGAARKGSAASDSGRDQSFQEKLDSILDKIKENGYENLTAEEKEFLYQASKK